MQKPQRWRDQTIRFDHVEPLTPPRGDLGTLTLLTGPKAGEVYTLDAAEVVIGRAPEPSGIVLPEQSISRSHVRISRRGDDYVIEDLGSRNGTFVEGERLIGQRILRDGEKVQLGVTALLAFALLDPLEREVSARVYESGTRDPLTGLYNRRVLFEHLDRELSYAARHFTALSLMLIDLDHFKSINDRWGHLAGDRVLEVVARTVTATLRTEDIVARYGGEELAVVVRGVDLASSHIVAERLRATIAHSEVLWEGDRVPITASLGLAHCVGGCHARDLIEAADGALYAAKREGRNRVMVAAPQGERR